MDQTPKVAETLLTARNGSCEYGVVLFEDGGYGITRDGQVDLNFIWTAVQIDACIERFMELAGIRIELSQDDFTPPDDPAPSSDT